MSVVKWAKSGYILAAMGLGVTGCATSNVTKVTQGAPITYKIGKGATQHASLPHIQTQPRAFTNERSSPVPNSAPMPLRAQPRLPSRGAPQQIVPQAAPINRNGFDQASVDTDLYKHQRVGKRYTIRGKSYTPKHQPRYDVVGTASWYGDKFHGKPTATGEIFNKNDLTAAHKTLPLNSILHVTNLENGKTLMVRLNDRGPFIGNRIIDLSEASAAALGITTHGLGKVRVQYAGPADPMAAQRSVQPSAPQPVPYPEDSYVEAPQIYAPAPTAPAPFSADPFIPSQPAPRMLPDVPSPIAPQAPQAIRPQQPEGSGEVTLTIEGPIHVARHNGQTNKPMMHRGRVLTKPKTRMKTK